MQHPTFVAVTQNNQNLQDMPIWLNADGDELTYLGFGSVIRDIKVKSGVNFHAHRLRHTFASIMAGQVGVFDLKELMGHSSITTTQIYVQQNVERLAEIHRLNSPLNVLPLGQKLKRRRGRPRKQEN